MQARALASRGKLKRNPTFRERKGVTCILNTPQPVFPTQKENQLQKYPW